MMKVWLYGLLAQSLGTKQQAMTTPMQINTAIYDETATSGRNNGSAVTITWATAKPTPTSKVLYGMDPGSLIYEEQASTNCATYSFCSYSSPCFHHVTIKDNLIAGQTYYYKCGDPVSGWSTVKKMTAPHPAGTEMPLKYGLIGDLGQTVFSKQTLRHLAKHENIEAVIHAGDLSYADSDQKRWDTWGKMVEPLAATLPWMVSAGNHEEERPCGSKTDPFVAYQRRFRMPFNAGDKLQRRNLYYSFRNGLVHFIMLTPYVESSKASDQFKWLQNELERVDRLLTPWICVTMHGPWYNSNTAHQNPAEPHFKMKDAMEDLLFKYGVDLVISGHVHAYERSFPVYKEKTRPDGTMYVVIGDGGNREGLARDFKQPSPAWSAFRKASYGFSILHVANKTHARIEWYENGDRSAILRDSSWILSTQYRRDASSTNTTMDIVM